jgi:molybdenum cofactor synthesis domain-containing protein
MHTHNLLHKTEITIDNIGLDGANLSVIAGNVAEILEMDKSVVRVVDYRNETMTLDVLDQGVDAHRIIGKKDRLLERLSGIPGVRVTGETSVRSDGMLGWIAMDEETGGRALRRSERIASEILANISKRVLVFSTGGEVADGRIEDTNTPAILRRLTSEGYQVTRGRTLADDKFLIAARLGDAAGNGGYALIVTTGGVGAEDKDHTVEAVLAVDPDAATPYICRFQVGTGRHVKDGIRIAVGLCNDTLIVALPGPNDEVNASLGVLVDGLKARCGKRELAENIAVHLREILRDKMSAHGNHGR